MPANYPIVRASVLTGFYRFLVACGVDAETLIENAGLSVAAILDPESPLPLNAVMTLLDRAAAATGDPCMGLTFSETFPLGGTGIYGYLISNSTTVDEALSTAARFAGLLRQPFEVHYDRDADGAVLWWCWPRSVEGPTKQYSSYALALLVGRLRQLSDANWEPTYVELPHEPLPCTDKARRIFGANIHYNSERVAVRVDAATLARRLPNADAQLRPILEKAGERLIADTPSSVDIVAATTATIRAQLPERRASLELVAERLGLSTRGLQSRLASEGTTFEALLNDARKLRAEELLKSTELPLTDIAIMLGFSELSSFTRAAQRWFGTSPSAHRSRLRASL